MPRIEQLLLAAPAELSDDEAEWRAYRARRRAERAGGAYIASLSFRTVTYKALCAADELGAFYLDLQRADLEVPFGIFHQRFSTNTAPSWERAQPFRFLCHNGEINAIQGNVNWMRAREGNFGTADDVLYHPVLDEAGSDSAMLDNALDFVVHGGRDIRHALSMLVPPAWEGNTELPQEVRDFYRYHAGLVEPWDGPAGIVFTDGRVVGAALDRNGLRPLRYAVCEDGFVVCSSEAGAVSVDGHGLVRRGKLGPGQMIAIDPERGLEDDDVIKRRLAAERPFGVWLAEGLVSGSTGSPVEPPEADLTARQALLRLHARGDRAVPAADRLARPRSDVLDGRRHRARAARRPRPDRSTTTSSSASPRSRTRRSTTCASASSCRCAPCSAAARPCSPRARRSPAGIELDSFFLFPDALEQFQPVRLDATFDPATSLQEACERLAGDAEAAVRAGAGMLLVADTAPERLPIPALLAVGAVHHRLVARQLRTKATLVVETDEAREVHHFACLLGYGAEAVCPRLALETLAAMAAADKVGGDRPSPAEAQLRFKHAVEDGVLKVMSKMGISDVASYCGAQIFDAVGLAHEVVERAFVGTPCPVGGIGFAELEREIRARFAAACGREATAREPGLREVAQGRRAARDERRRRRRRARARRGARAPKGRAERRRVPRAADLYTRFAGLVNGREPMEPRDLLEVVPAGPPVALEEVEPVEAILRRFSGARCRTGRSRPRRTRRSRSPSTGSAARRTPARAARTRSVSGTSATARSSRSRRGASA